MAWTDHTVFWHLFTLRFVGAEDVRTGELHHRLTRITGWLDYLLDLGANGLLLAPIFESTSHGYDTLDHYTIDARLGDEGDFNELIKQAHARGIRVVLDGVFNHLDRSHAIVQKAIAAGPGTEAGDWIRWTDGYPYCFEGSENLVELNLSNPAVQDFVTEIMIHWLDRGADGWRLDAAYAAGAAAWQPIVTRVRAAHPDVWLLGEVIHGDYVDFVTASGVDTVTQYELWKAIWSSLNDKNFFELQWTLSRHAEFCEHFVPQTFIGNHDVTRIATKVEDQRDLPLAVALLLLLPGVPSIYAGDEQGFTGEKIDAPRGDDAVRPAFPETPAELLPYGAHILELYQELIGIRRRNPWLLRASMDVSHLTNTTMVIKLSEGDHELILALNSGDDPVELPSSDGPLHVDGHSWIVSPSS